MDYEQPPSKTKETRAEYQKPALEQHPQFTTIVGLSI
jgi:hypothetical protein